jgi:5-methylcytosine-specific restriction endonuclease McrA
MKHLELVCELIVSGAREEVIHKKAALDHAMSPKGMTQRELEKGVRATVACLNRLQRMFPHLRQTRFRKLSDFYSLAVLMQKFERERLILTDRRRNGLAWDLLVALGTGVDQVSEKRRKLQTFEPGHELHREYLRTVLEGTDKIENRRRREQILRGLLEPIFQKKDAHRFFSEEQRRILWNSAEERKCARCDGRLTWGDFDADHIRPYTQGGRTDLDNAALLCRSCNARKGARQAVFAAPVRRTAGRSAGCPSYWEAPEAVVAPAG